MFNVMRRFSLRMQKSAKHYLQTRRKCLPWFSHELKVLLWSSVWPCWLGPAAAGPLPC